MIKAISPSDIPKAKADAIPEAVIKVFNDMIARNFSGRSATVIQKDVVEELVNNHGMFRETIFGNGYLNVEEIYRDQGYDKPSYCENYGAYFEFSVK